jgi:MHS family proline/betaine transporter-like MFS transporter
LMLSVTARYGYRGRRADQYRALVAAVMGSVLEWYDFTIYGALAIYISLNFFPASDPGAGLLATFALFGVGFLFRPLGAFVIGWIGDTRGRKPALLVAIVAMAAGTLSVALIPSYKEIRFAAPILLLVARLAQGFSAGGEFGVAIAFLAEWSPDDRRTLWTSFLSISVAFGSLLASGLTALLITTLPQDDMYSWGWRIPFLLGGILGPVARWMRSRVHETPLYREKRAIGATWDRTSTRKNLKAGLRAFGFAIHWTVCYYVFLFYMPTFTRIHAHLSVVQAAWSNTISLVAIVAAVPVVASLADRYGRKPFLLASCGAVMLLSLPAFWLVVKCESFAATICIQMGLGLAIALYSGPGPAAMAELFGVRNRSLLISTSYALAASLFGGFAPFIADSLIKRTGSALAPTAYAIAAASVSFLVVLWLPEVRERNGQAQEVTTNSEAL